MLLKALPAAASEKDGVGNLPLHVAARQGACIEVVDMLLKAHPAAASEKHTGGNQYYTDIHLDLYHVRFFYPPLLFSNDSISLKMVI